MRIRKFELHWDAVAAIVLVFMISLGFNLYQRHQYRGMMQASIEAQMSASNTRADVEIAQMLLDRCRNPKD